MKTAKEILAKQWKEKYHASQYENSHLHYNYEDLVLKAMNEYAIEVLKELDKVFDMHEQNSASVSNTINFKIQEIERQLKQ